MKRHLLGHQSVLGALTSLIVAALLACAPAAETPDSPRNPPDSETELIEYLMTLKLGTVHFPTSGSEAAQRYFVQGVAALHNFTYYDAGILFRAAQAVDPDFAMAYWGEALTHTATVWQRYPGGQQHRDEAIEVLNRLGATPEARAAKAPTALEKGFVAAAEALYLGDADKAARDQAYFRAMRDLSGQHPDHEEALAFYCVSRLAATRSQQGRRGAAAVALELLMRNPAHPGAFRCLIHSVDNAERAPFGLVATRRYTETAPDTHAAYHMPAHIFIQLGRWNEASRHSERAIALAREWIERRGLDIAEVDDHTYGHLLDYLQYSLLQEGRYRDAKALVDEVRADYEDSGKAAAIRFKVASTSARYLIETEQWDDAAELAELAKAEGFAQAPAVLLAVGIGAVQTGDLELAREAAAGLERAGPEASVMAQEVSALIHLSEGDEATALRLLGEAARTTHATDLPLGPANPMKPVLELYGEVLLKLGRPQEALEQFEAALLRRPGRPASLLGVTQANAQM